MSAINAIDFFPSFCKLPVNYFIFALNKLNSIILIITLYKNNIKLNSNSLL
jgi:hypothetical protein